jgi:cytochrome P450
MSTGSRVFPPGPATGRLSGTVAFHRDPLGFLRSANREFGEVFTIRLATTGPIVVVADPAAAEALAELDPGGSGAAAHAGEARRGVLPMASVRSVFGADGAQHRTARDRAWPAFSGEAITARIPQIEAIVQRHVDGWPRARPTRLLPRMRRLADEIFVREVLGVRDESRVLQLIRSIGGLMWTPGNPPTTIPGPSDGVLGRIVDAAYTKRRHPIAQTIEQELAERRARGETGSGVLGLLLEDEPRLEDRAIVEELLALLMAAQEPMAAALTWLALGLGARPEIAERLRGEEPGGDYERAVIQESLRLHPPAIGMLRRLVRPVIIAGHELAAGTSTMSPIPLLQRDARRFDQPDRFLPERHVDANGERSRDAAKSEIWPFGHGARRCIAEVLARAQLGVTLRTLLDRVSIRTLGSQPERMVLRATILVPRRSGLALLSDRAE